MVTGCGHAGIINILIFARQEFPNEPVEAVIGGLHHFPATDEQLDWTADKMKEFKVANLIGTHCTGIEAVYHIRERLGLPRASVGVGSVGSELVLAKAYIPARLPNERKIVHLSRTGKWTQRLRAEVQLSRRGADSDNISANSDRLHRWDRARAEAEGYRHRATRSCSGRGSNREGV